MRERMERLKTGWTNPNVFPWDELTDIICELDEKLTAQTHQIDVLQRAQKERPAKAAKPAKEHAGHA